jgi:hypothetical protein
VNYSQEKQFLLDFGNKILDSNLLATPGFIFSKLLRNKIKDNLWNKGDGGYSPGLALNLANQIVGLIKIDLSLFGQDAEPHMEWLTEMSEIWGDVIYKVFKTHSTEFNREFALTSIQEVYIEAKV